MSVWFQNLNFIGHTVGSGILRPGESKVKAVQEASKPQPKRQVKSSLGLVGFFRKYISNFASVAVPLTDLRKTGLPNQVNWGESQEYAFNALKHSLTNSPILHMPDLDKIFYKQMPQTRV